MTAVPCFVSVFVLLSYSGGLNLLPGFWDPGHTDIKHVLFPAPVFFASLSLPLSFLRLCPCPYLCPFTLSLSLICLSGQTLSCDYLQQNISLVLVLVPVSFLVSRLLDNVPVLLLYYLGGLNLFSGQILGSGSLQHTPNLFLSDM